MGNDTSASLTPGAAEQSRRLMDTREIWEPLKDVRNIPIVLGKLLQTYPPYEDSEKFFRTNGHLPPEIDSAILSLLDPEAGITHPGLMVIPIGDAGIDVWRLRTLRLGNRVVPNPAAQTFGDSYPFCQPEPVHGLTYSLRFGVIVHVGPTRKIGWKDSGESIFGTANRIVISDMATLDKVRFVQTTDL